MRQCLLLELQQVPVLRATAGAGAAAAGASAAGAELQVLLAAGAE